MIERQLIGVCGPLIQMRDASSCDPHTCNDVHECSAHSVGYVAGRVTHKRARVMGETNSVFKLTSQHDQNLAAFFEIVTEDTVHVRRLMLHRSLR